VLEDVFGPVDAGVIVVEAVVDAAPAGFDVVRVCSKEAIVEVALVSEAEAVIELMAAKVIDGAYGSFTIIAACAPIAPPWLTTSIADLRWHWSIGLVLISLGDFKFGKASLLCLFSESAIERARRASNVPYCTQPQHSGCSLALKSKSDH
jgi:hypothetical protein